MKASKVISRKGRTVREGSDMQGPHCGWKAEQWLWKVPDEIPALARKVLISVKQLKHLIQEGRIPIRVMRGTRWRKRGYVVLIHEVLDGIRGSR